MTSFLMKRVRFLKNGDRVVETAEARCGEAFCDTCGECLHCYGPDDCPWGETHAWVEYEGVDFDGGYDD